MKKRNHQARIADDRNKAAGVKKHLSDVPQLIIAGTQYAPDEAVAILEARAAGSEAAVTARVALTTAVKAAIDQRTRTKPFASSLHQMVIAMFGNRPDILADFGVAPRKEPTIKLETKVAAVEKNLATRKARHTMGSKQRSLIHGDVPPEVTAPLAATGGDPPKPV